MCVCAVGGLDLIGLGWVTLVLLCSTVNCDFWGGVVMSGTHFERVLLIILEYFSIHFNKASLSGLVIHYVTLFNPTLRKSRRKYGDVEVSCTPYSFLARTTDYGLCV